METLFFFVISFCLIFSSIFDKPEDNRIVNLGNLTKIERSILAYNETTEDDVELNKSVGNHGRYKNVGFDHEFLKHGFITDKERERGLRWYTKNGYNFIYMESEKTLNFIRWLDGARKTN